MAFYPIEYASYVREPLARMIDILGRLWQLLIFLGNTVRTSDAREPRPDPTYPTRRIDHQAFHQIIGPWLRSPPHRPPATRPSRPSNLDVFVDPRGDSARCWGCGLATGIVAVPFPLLRGRPFNLNLPWHAGTVWIRGNDRAGDIVDIALHYITPLTTDALGTRHQSGPRGPSQPKPRDYKRPAVRPTMATILTSTLQALFFRPSRC